MENQKLNSTILSDTCPSDLELQTIKWFSIQRWWK